MDDVNGLADRSNQFANFLRGSRKYRLTCVYIFHTIYPARQNSQMIMLQTKIFNFFLDSVQASSIIKTLSSFASRYKNNYMSNRNLWINLLYYEISNSAQKQSLKIETRDVNELGLATFRTLADSGTEQIFYYNRSEKNACSNPFLAVLKQAASPFEINFSIVKAIDSANRKDVIYSEISNKLSDFKNDKVQRTVQQISESDFAREAKGKQPDRQWREHTGNERISKKPRFLLR